MTDYRKMWQDLGMDVETHDQLCAVLPGAVNEVFLKRDNRPEAFNYYLMVLADIHGIRPAELIEHQKKGGKVFGTFCLYVPDEIIFAAGGIATGLCGGSQFWVPGGEKVLPAATCPLIKASIGARLDRTCPFFRISDVFIGETTCDGKKKAWEILSKDAETHVMHLPQAKRRRDIESWKEEIRDLLRMAEEKTGNKVTAESLLNSIKLINNKRRALARLYECRKALNVPITGTDALLITQIAFYDDPARFTEMTNSLCDELEEKIKTGKGAGREKAARILLTGTPLAIPNWKMHAITESLDAVIVCEEMCTGVRYFENLVDEGGKTIEDHINAIAERYMKLNCACFTPNEGRIDDIIRLAKEYRADGVIDLSLKFCSLYDIEGGRVEKALKDEGIPVMGLETDYSEQDSEQLKTRIEAFIEMIR